MIFDILTKVREKSPLVTHITNLVTINDCANITLSVGASPLMTFCKEELDDILSFSSSLVLNIGTMDAAMQDMAIDACKKANDLNVPVILDPVGVGATKKRKELVNDLLKCAKFSVIKGNVAEIKSLCGMQNAHNKGVDSLEVVKNPKELLMPLAKELDTTIAMSGEVDVISDGKRVAFIKNGIKELSLISGTGCMSASLIASANGVCKDSFLNAIFGLSLMGVSAEISKNEAKKGNGSLKVALFDAICQMDVKTFKNLSKVQIE